MSSHIPVTSAPLTEAEQLIGMIDELQRKLDAKAPDYVTLLQRIHMMLTKDDTLAHMLKPEQIGTIVNGLSRKMNVVIAATPSKGVATKTGRKPASQLTADDLI